MTTNQIEHVPCLHTHVKIIKPCCTAPDESGRFECGCGGDYQVICSDCDNADMTDDEAQDILEEYLDGEYHAPVK